MRGRSPFKFLGIVSILVLVASVALPGLTLAKEGTRSQALVNLIAGSSDPAKAYLGLSPSDQTAVREYLTVTSVESGPQIAPATPLVVTSGGCWQVTWSVVGKDVFGFVLWQYSQKNYNWCGDGSKITVAGQVTRWPSNMAPFWQYTPLGGIQIWGGVGATSQRAFSQGQMALCVPPGGCEQYQYPWIDQTVYPNGTVGGDTGA